MSTLQLLIVPCIVLALVGGAILLFNRFNRPRSLEKLCDVKTMKRISVDPPRVVLIVQAAKKYEDAGHEHIISELKRLGFRLLSKREVNVYFDSGELAAYSHIFSLGDDGEVRLFWDPRTSPSPLFGEYFYVITKVEKADDAGWPIFKDAA